MLALSPPKKAVLLDAFVYGQCPEKGCRAVWREEPRTTPRLAVSTPRANALLRERLDFRRGKAAPLWGAWVGPSCASHLAVCPRCEVASTGGQGANYRNPRVIAESIRADKEGVRL